MRHQRKTKTLPPTQLGGENGNKEVNRLKAKTTNMEVTITQYQNIKADTTCLTVHV